jgi:hypothetical protein
MRKGPMLFAVTGEIPDVVLSHRFGHEHASFNAAGGWVPGPGAMSPCRTFATNGLTLRRFVDLSIAHVNLNTELDFLLGAGVGLWCGQCGAPAGQLGGVMGVEWRRDGLSCLLFVIQSGHQRGADWARSRGISCRGEALYPPPGGMLAGPQARRYKPGSRSQTSVAKTTGETRRWPSSALFQSLSPTRHSGT